MKLIVVSGLPGSGKSTLAEGLSQKLNLPVFSVDPIESAIINSGIKRSFKTGLAAYLVVENLAAEQLKLGHSVIIDAVSPVQEARAMWHSLENKFNGKLIIIECILDPKIHKERIESRVRNIHGIPEITWQDVEKCRNEYVEWTEQRLVVDTSSSFIDILNTALQYIADFK